MNAAVNTGSPVSSSDTVEDGNSVSATFCSMKVRQVLSSARKAIVPQATGCTAATFTGGSKTSAHARATTNEATICVPATVVASSCSKPRSPNTSAPANATEDSSARISPKPNEGAPPLLHKR